MDQQELQKHFDYPISDEKVEKLAKRMIEDGFKMNCDEWLRTESKDFYKGMIAALRVVSSYAIQYNYSEQFLDFLSHININCFYMVYELNEMSKKEG